MDVNAWRNLRPISAIMVGGTLLLSIGTAQGFFNEQRVIFLPDRIAQGELWRLVTGLFYVGKFDSSLVFGLLAAYEVSANLETTYYNSTKQYLLRLLLLAATAMLLSTFLLTIPMPLLMFCVEYLSAHRVPAEANMRIAVLLPLSEEVYFLYLMLAQFNNMTHAYLAAMGIMLLVTHALLYYEDIRPMWTKPRIAN